MPMPAPLLSSFAPSLSGGFALFGRRDSDVVIPTYTNAQKLSLASNTAVGTRVKVSDGFVVSGAGPLYDGAQLPIGTFNGKPMFGKFGTNRSCGYNGTAWGFGTTDGDFGDVVAVNGNESNPWDADWSGSGATLTHPAVQQLQAPSSAQGGVFVSGGSQDGIYTIGDNNGRAVYFLLGVAVNSDNISVTYWDGSQWITYDSGASPLYYSLSNVATPDLASNWKNASDDSPASITVTSVTQGELDAGVTIVGSDDDGKFTKSGYGPSQGRFTYGLSSDVDLSYSEGDGGWLGIGSLIADSTGGAVPWQKTYGSATVTRNNVAAEANWSNV